MRLFAMCEAMRWAHLPVAGGLYDQHPKLLADWEVIWAAKHAHDSKNKPK